MDSEEFSMYMAYNRISPMGEQRADLRAGIIASVMANVMGGGKTAPSDFMPDFKKEVKRQTPADMLVIAKMMTARLKGTVK